MTVYDEHADISCQEMIPTPPAGGESAPVPRLYRRDDLLRQFADDAAAAREAFVTGTPRGPVTGFPTLDKAICGFLAPGLHMVHGGPGVGKTALALQIAGSCRCPALYVSCEMGPLELLRRITARTTGTFLGRLKSGELEVREAVLLARQAIEAVPALAIVDGMTAHADPTWLAARAVEIKGDARHVFLVIDSLHSWTQGAGTNDTEYDALNAAILNLGRMAGALQAPVLVIAERNRAAMQQGGLHAGAGSRRIEYGGELVLGLDAEDMTPDLAGEVRVTARVEKNRNGAPGLEIPLVFHGALQRFREA